MSKWLWLYRRLTKKLWYRASLYCVMGIVAALIAKVIGPLIPGDFPQKVGVDAVGAILTIIASSMLAVTTFSLTTMVSATAAASQSATPRVTKLLVEDTTAQRALSTFLGAFLFGDVSERRSTAHDRSPGIAGDGTHHLDYDRVLRRTDQSQLDHLWPLGR